MSEQLSKKIAVFPGSFDPFTNGHYDLVKRTLGVFDQVVILIADHVEKKSWFTSNERKEMLELLFKNNSQVSVEVFSGLTADYLKQKNIRHVVRGIRGSFDFEDEQNMATLNRDLNPELDTFILFTRPELRAVSSRYVKEILVHGGSIEKYVPSEIYPAVLKRSQQLASNRK